MAAAGAKPAPEPAPEAEPTDEDLLADMLEKHPKYVKKRSPFNSPANVVARFLLVMVFLSGSVTKFLAIQPKYADPKLMAAAVAPVVRAVDRLNAAAGTAFVLEEKYHKNIFMFTAMVEGLGGFLVVQNHKFGAIILIMLSLPLTFVTHTFWEEDPDQPEYMNQLSHFLKSIGIIGGLLSFIATSDGEPLKTSRKARLDMAEKIALKENDKKWSLPGMTGAPAPVASSS